MFRAISTILVFMIFLPGAGLASDPYAEQMKTIIKLHETLARTGSPTVSDFLMLFGDDNEAELKLILHRKFPSLDLKGNWFENKMAADYVDNVFKNPEEHESFFLQCLKSKGLILDKTGKWQIEFPPELTKDFRRFRVLTNGKKIIVEFSQGERTIENIYLPGGESIYNLIGICAKGK